MAKLEFPFVEKEGKHFAPIVQEQDKYIVRDGAVEADGTKIVSGIKGVYAQVRIKLTSTDKAELFAVNTEAVHSSN